MAPNTGIMNQVLQTFLDKIAIGVGVVGFDARGLLGILATMELILVALWWAYSGNEAISKLLRKVLTIFFFIWVIDNYSQILTWVTHGFVWTGYHAAGASAVNIDDPSGIFHMGFQVAKPILVHTKAKPGLLGGGFFDALICWLSAIVIIIAYFILALQIFLTRIEFALISTLGLILVPFGVFKYTAFMAEKVFGAVISFGVKLMVLAFIISVGYPLMQTLSLPPDPSWPEMFSIMFGSLAVALLSIHAPGVASGLLSGGPSLTFGAASGTGLAVGGTVVGAGVAAMGAKAAASGMVGTLGNGVTKGTRVASTWGRGVVSQAGEMAAMVNHGKEASKSGVGIAGTLGKASHTAGTVVGTAAARGKVVSGASAKAFKNYKRKVKSGLASLYSSGKDRVNHQLRSNGASQSKSSQSTSSSKKSSSSKTDSKAQTNHKSHSSSKDSGLKNKTNNFNKASTAANMATSGTQSAVASSGMQARLREDERDD